MTIPICFVNSLYTKELKNASENNVLQHKINLGYRTGICAFAHIEKKPILEEALSLRGGGCTGLQLSSRAKGPALIPSVARQKNQQMDFCQY